MTRQIYDPPIKGLILAAPTSGSGKTLVTLGLLRSLTRRNLPVLPAKSGPDYIDPMFHEFASGEPAVNLDCWAMSRDMIGQIIAKRVQASEILAGCHLIVEGAMGILDGAGREGYGNVADLAEILELPVVMIVNAAKQAQSVSLAPLGLRQARPNTVLAGVILNGIGSERHLAGAKHSLEEHGIKVFGWLPKRKELVIPSRHLGLILPSENSSMEALVDAVADQMEKTVDIDCILHATQTLSCSRPSRQDSYADPLGQTIGLACDQAFCFTYRHVLDMWHAAGASIKPFSPLSDEGPADDVDAVFLPGGYPEIYLKQMAGNNEFRSKMISAQSRGALIYGECGGFMVLGRAIEDAEGQQHEMLGLLPHTTSMQSAKLHLGYRLLKGRKGTPFEGNLFAGHEFHYSRMKSDTSANRLFAVQDAFGNRLPEAGLAIDNVCGSYCHTICQRRPT